MVKKIYPYREVIIYGLVLIIGLLNKFFFDIFWLILFLGAIFNLIAIFSNKGRMPVYIPWLKRNQYLKRHKRTSNKKAIKWFYFCDIFHFYNVKKKYLVIHYFSVGDVLIILGIIGVLVNLFKEMITLII